MESFITIDHNSSVPKYEQIISSIYLALENKLLVKGQQLPSINDICKEFSLSRDTVMSAYNTLKTKGIINASPRKGYYVTSTRLEEKHNVFLLFDELTAYKEVLYNSFKESTKGKAAIDIFFHHNNPRLFDRLIQDSIGNYTSYIVMPLIKKNTSEILDLLPKKKLIILDRDWEGLGQKFRSVFQNFEKDIFQSLNSALSLIKKYQKLILIFPSPSIHPKELVLGLKKFSKSSGIEHQVVNEFEDIKLGPKQAYIVIEDSDLVQLIIEAKERGLEIGKDIGIISYNETPLKKVVANGITTISTDFKLMGENLAKLLLNKKTQHIENSCFLIKRGSL